MTKDANSRRKLAEELLNRDPEATPVVRTADAQKLVHELQVYQIELEMQNEELRRSQVDLATSRDAYAELYDFAPVGYLTLDRAGLIIEANLTAAVLLGMERGKLCAGRNFSKFVAHESQDTWFLTWRDQLQAGRLRDCEVGLMQPDNHPRYARLAFAVANRPSTDTWRCMLTMSDITERRAAHDALLASRAQLAAIVESAMDAILLVDENQRVVHFNPAAERVFGCSASQALGQPADHFMPNCHLMAHASLAPKPAGGGTVPLLPGAVGEVVGQRADGTQFPMEGTLSQFEVGGRSVYTLILRDITERRRSEEQIQQHVRSLEVANADLARFNRSVVDRELRMIELKKEINAMCASVGQPPRFDLKFALESRA